MTLAQAGLLSFPLRDYGHWLRVVVRVSGETPSARVIIYLALKE